MRYSLRFILTAAAFALAVSPVTTGFAAPSTWERIDVTRHSGQDGSVLLVSGELPASESLPAEALLSVPAGLELQWIGEVLGGPASEDPELKYAKTTVNGVDLYRFTLTKSRTAQIEVPTPGGQAFDGSTYTSSLSWTAAQDVPEVRLNLRVPQAAQITTPVAGASLAPSDAGYSFYSKTVNDVKAGDQLALAVGYSLPAVAAAASAGSAPAGGSSVVPMMLVLLVLAAFVALIVAVRRKMVPSAYDDGVESESGDSSSRSARSVEPTVTVDASAESRPALPGKTKRNLVTAAIIGGLIVAAVVVGVQSTRPQLSGDAISQTFSAGQPCAHAIIAITVSDGADPRKTAETLFAALRPLPGLNTASYNPKTSSLDIGYCESSSSEAVLKSALAPTGLVAVGGAVATPVPTQ
jgi:hypothetical protein